MPHTPPPMPMQLSPCTPRRRALGRAATWALTALLTVGAGRGSFALAAREPQVSDDDFGAPPAESIAPRYRRHPLPPVHVAPPTRLQPVPQSPARKAMPQPALRPAPAPLRPAVAPTPHPLGRPPMPTTARVPPGRRPPPHPAEDIEEIETTQVQVAAQGPQTWWGDAWPSWDRVVDAYTARTVRRRTFGTLISHRNFGGFTQKPFHTLFGFDAGSLKVGLGLRYGILDDLDVGILRLNATSELFNTYEFDARYNFLSQANYGVDLALRVGLSWFEQYHANDASGFFAQLLMDRIVFNRVMLGGGLLMHTSSSGPQKSTTDTHMSAALQAYMDWRIYDGMSFALEITPHIAGYGLKAPVITFGPRFITNRHTFSIVMTNSQYTGADGIITGSNRSFSRWLLGFNITREL